MTLEELRSYFFIPVQDKLFKFYCFNDDEKLNDAKIETLKRGNLYLSTFDKQNDPLELRNLDMNEPKIEAEEDRAIWKKIKEMNLALKFSVKFSSLTSEDMNSSYMWEKYANLYNGFMCEFQVLNNENKRQDNIIGIEYTNREDKITPKLILMFDEFYEKNKHSFKENYSKIDFVKDLYKILSSTKTPDWCKEKEFRAIDISEGSSSGEEKELSYFNLKLKSIYIGDKCNEKYINRLYDSFKDEEINLYIRKKNGTKYIFEKIK